MKINHDNFDALCPFPGLLHLKERPVDTHLKARENCGGSSLPVCILIALSEIYRRQQRQMAAHMKPSALLFNICFEICDLVLRSNHV